MRLFPIILLLLLSTDCRESKKAVKEADKIIKDYPKVLSEIPKKTRIITEIRSIRQAIEVYRISNGEFPDSLGVLSIKIENKDNYIYNNRTGEVKSKHYPEI